MSYSPRCVGLSCLESHVDLRLFHSTEYDEALLEELKHELLVVTYVGGGVGLRMAEMRELENYFVEGIRPGPVSDF